MAQDADPFDARTEHRSPLQLARAVRISRRMRKKSVAPTMSPSTIKVTQSAIATACLLG
jgi:hypothetical protein